MYKKFNTTSRSRFRGRDFNRKNNKKAPVKQNHDFSKFINKAVELEKPQEYIAQNKFEDFQIDPKLKANIRNKGYLNPTPIQDQSIPLILKGKDVVGIANTGTGKTAAFLIPFLNKVLHDRRERVLILAPTRELALQIEKEFMGFARGLNIYSALCIGGTNMGRQIRDLKRSYHFLIGTPGRIKDLLQRKLIHLNTFKNIVLDEADRMLDMGFIHDIKYLLGYLPEERHSLFFSATVSPQIKVLINSFLKDPMTVSVKVRETSANINQDIVKIPTGKKRTQVLEELLIQREFQKVLVFGKTKHGVEKLSIFLAEKGFRVASIHGNKTQSKRQFALNLFKENKIQVLVATDVAARGLDIPDVSHVINYDIPATYEDYVHRIGRTGRADKRGKALTFV